MTERRFSQVILEVDESVTAERRFSQVLLEVDAAPPILVEPPLHPIFIPIDKLGKGGEYSAFLDQMRTGHQIRVEFFVMDADETHAVNISDVVTAGQVDLDVSRDPDRWLQFTLLDPEYRVAFAEPNAPHSGGLWAGSVIQVWYSVLVPDIGDSGAWVEVPVFTGPVQTLTRDSQQVNVQAVGKEQFLMPPNSYDNVFSKARTNTLNSTRKAALTALLNACGEPQDVLWEGINSKLPKNFDPVKSFHHGGDSYLKLVRTIVGEHNQFWYDGQGRPRVRKAKSDAVTDLSGMELTVASESFDMSKVRNKAVATIQRQPTHKTGQTPPPITVIEKLRPNQTMSAQSLERNGVDRYLLEKGTGTYKSTSDAKNAATHILSAGTTEDVTLDVMPVPFLQPYDQVKVQRPVPVGSSADTTVKLFKVKSFSLPLHVGDGMSLGYTRKVLDPRHSKPRFIKAKAKHARR